MAMEVRLMKKDGRFIPSDHLGFEEMQSIAEGEHFVAKITRPRNLAHHRKFFAFVGIVFDAQERYPTSEHLLDAIKIGIGHYDLLHITKTKTVIKTRSISFGNMGQKAFEQIYERAILWTVGPDGPLFGTGKRELEQQIAEFLGE